MKDLIDSWMLSLRARNLAPKTLLIYRDAAERLTSFMLAAGVPLPTRRVVEEFLAMRADTTAPGNVSLEFRALRQFFKWLALEGDGVDVMVGLEAPIVPEKPVPLLTLEEVGRLIGDCKNARNEMTRRRDEAIIRFFADSGPRLGEVAGIAVTDVDLPSGLVRVIGKGRRERLLPIGAKTVAAFDRYRRARNRHPCADMDAFWLAERRYAPITSTGIAQMLDRRATAVGIEGMHAHRFRHTFAHEWLNEGGGENDLMRIAGWRSRSMLARYGAAAADERARLAHRRMGLGDRV